MRPHRLGIKLLPLPANHLLNKIPHMPPKGQLIVMNITIIAAMTFSPQNLPFKFLIHHFIIKYKSRVGSNKSPYMTLTWCRRGN